MRDGEVAIPVLRSASRVPWQTKGQRSMNEVNTLHWHDAKKHLPYNDKSTKMVAYKNSDEDNLQWMVRISTGRIGSRRRRLFSKAFALNWKSLFPM